jgi:hypothetical protein
MQMTLLLLLVDALQQKGQTASFSWFLTMKIWFVDPPDALSFRLLEH